MFVIHFKNSCVAKKSKLSTVRKFCTHFHRNTVVFGNNQKKILENSNLKKFLKGKNFACPD